MTTHRQSQKGRTIWSRCVSASVVAGCAVVALPAGSSPAADATLAQALNARWAEQSFTARSSSPPVNQVVLIHNDDAAHAPVLLNRSVTGQALRLAEKTYAHGFGLNATVVMRVTLEKPARRFLADIGVDRHADGQAASVRFRISVGGKEVFVSEIMRAGSRQSIEVPLAGAQSFELTVDDGGDGRSWDQANWSDPRVELEDGTELLLDDVARLGGPVSSVPFSFVYGGKPSAELLPQWRAEEKDEALNATTRCRTLTFTDPQTGLEVKAVAKIYQDTAGVDWTVHFTNTGSQNTPVIEQVRSMDVRLNPAFGSPTTLHQLRGSAAHAEAWLPVNQVIGQGSVAEFGAEAGRPAKAISPFFTLDWGDGGVVTAVGWSGQWQGRIERTDQGQVRMQAGMQFLHLSLRPGESIRTPRVLQVHWQGADRDTAHNLFRRTMLKHIMPQMDGQPVMPPIAHLSTSFYELDRTDEANTLSHLHALHGLGFETFWLDAYWIRDGFPNGVGHYGFPLSRVEPADRFPKGLKPMGDAVHEAGMKFLLWFEPERVTPGTAIAKEHPDWVITAAGDQGFNSGLFDLGLPAARDYMTGYLKAAIREYGVDCLRIDFNINPLPSWQVRNTEQPDRVGISEIRYVEGLYQMWDDLRAEFPRLVIDNCASGGTRIDLETSARSIALWRTDDTIQPLLQKDFHQAALQNQVMTAGLNRYLPFTVSGQMGATPYCFRSGFNAGIAFAEDCRPADYPRDQLRAAIAEGKRLRHYYTGDFYPISEVSTDPRDWCVMQHHHPNEEDGLVIAFRRHRSPFAAYQCALRGIDPTATYEVTRSVGYQPQPLLRIDGAELQRLKVEIEEAPGSVVLEYNKLKP